MKKRSKCFKLLAGVLSFIMIFSAIVMTTGMKNMIMAEEGDAAGENSDTESPWTYVENEDGTLTITGVGASEYSDGTLTIPAEIDGKKVTAVGNGTPIFEYNSHLSEIVISEGITTLGACVFQYSTADKIIFPKSVSEVDARWGIYGEQTRIYAYSGSVVESIARPYFYCMFYMIDKPYPVSGDFVYEVMESGNARIVEYTGSERDVVIPSEIDGVKVTSISSWAFYGNASVESVVISDGITSIGHRVFKYCDNLRKIVLPESLTYFGDGSLCDIMTNKYHKAEWTAGPVGSGCNIEFAWTEEIPDRAFYNDFIDKITLPDTIVKIGDFALCDSRISSIALPSGLQTIGREAFGFCKNLNGVVIPSGITKLEEMTFYFCNSLTDIEIPENVKSIGNEAFAYTDKLETITINAGDVHLGDGVFKNSNSDLCIKGYTGSEAEQYANDNNITFESIGNYEPQEPGEAGEKEYGDFKYVVNDDGTITITGYTGKSSSDVDIPQTIGDKSVTVIGENAFNGARLFGTITIPEGVTKVSRGAFFNSNAMKIVFPRSVSTIEDNYLDTFFQPTRICVYKASKAYEHFNQFEDGDTDTILEAVDEPYGTFGDFSYRVNENGTVTLISYNGDGKAVEIPEEIDGKKVTYIYKYCFFKSDIESVKIPDSVTRIGARAFSNSLSLASVNIPDSVTQVDLGAFTMCTSLKKLVIPASVTVIQQGAFAFNIGDTSVAAVTAGPIGSGADIEFGWTDTIPTNAFDHSNITEIVIPASVTKIEDAFFNCVRLKKVTIEGKDTEIYNEYAGAFENCNNFTIYGVADSKAEAFAKERGYTFKLIGSEEPKVPENQVPNRVIEEIEQGAVITSATVEAGKESYMPKDFVQVAKDKGAVIVLKVEKDGKPVVTYTIDGTKFDGTPDSDLKLDVTKGEKNTVTDNVKKQLKVKNDSDIYLCEFAHSGKLNGQLVITIYTEDYESGTEVKVFYYNEETGVAEDMNFTRTVEEDGAVSFPVTHFSSYLLVKTDAINSEDVPQTPSETEPSENPTEKPSETEPSENPTDGNPIYEYESPSTGFAASTTMYAVIVIMIFGIFGVYVTSVRKNKK